MKVEIEIGNGNNIEINNLVMVQTIKRTLIAIIEEEVLDLKNTIDDILKEFGINKKYKKCILKQTIKDYKKSINDIEEFSVDISNEEKFNQILFEYFRKHLFKSIKKSIMKYV